MARGKKSGQTLFFTTVRPNRVDRRTRPQFFFLYFPLEILFLSVGFFVRRPVKQSPLTMRVHADDGGPETSGRNSKYDVNFGIRA